MLNSSCPALLAPVPGGVAQEKAMASTVRTPGQLASVAKAGRRYNAHLWATFMPLIRITLVKLSGDDILSVVLVGERQCRRATRLR